jgi:hypothetical protein
MQTDVKRSVPLAHRWKCWIAQNKLLNAEDRKIIDILMQNGIEVNVASEEVRAVASNCSS